MTESADSRKNCDLPPIALAAGLYPASVLELIDVSAQAWINPIKS
jgi:hypothetical protein